MENPPLKVEEESTNPFDQWWADEHGTGKLEIEAGVDECLEDDYSDRYE